MNKEEILSKKTGGIFDGYEGGITGIFNAMEEFAKLQSVEFFKWNAQKIHEYMDYLRRVDKSEGIEEMELELNYFEGGTIEYRYTQFIKYQQLQQSQNNQ